MNKKQKMFKISKKKQCIDKKQTFWHKVYKSSTNTPYKKNLYEVYVFKQTHLIDACDARLQKLIALSKKDSGEYRTLKNAKNRLLKKSCLKQLYEIGLHAAILGPFAILIPMTYIGAVFMLVPGLNMFIGCAITTGGAAITMTHTSVVGCLLALAHKNKKFNAFIHGSWISYKQRKEFYEVCNNNQITNGYKF